MLRHAAKRETLCAADRFGGSRLEHRSRENRAEKSGLFFPDRRAAFRLAFPTNKFDKKHRRRLSEETRVGAESLKGTFVSLSDSSTRRRAIFVRKENAISRNRGVLGIDLPRLEIVDSKKGCRRDRTFRVPFNATKFQIIVAPTWEISIARLDRAIKLRNETTRYDFNTVALSLIEATAFTKLLKISATNGSYLFDRDVTVFTIIYDDLQRFTTERERR